MEKVLIRFRQFRRERQLAPDPIRQTRFHNRNRLPGHSLPRPKKCKSIGITCGLLIVLRKLRKRGCCTWNEWKSDWESGSEHMHHGTVRQGSGNERTPPSVLGSGRGELFFVFQNELGHQFADSFTMNFVSGQLVRIGNRYASTIARCFDSGGHISRCGQILGLNSLHVVGLCEGFRFRQEQFAIPERECLSIFIN